MWCASVVEFQDGWMAAVESIHAEDKDTNKQCMEVGKSDWNAFQLPVYLLLTAPAYSRRSHVLIAYKPVS